MRKSTKSKYTRFINECYNFKKFDVKSLRQNHETSNVLITVMHRLKIINTKDNITTWAAGPVSKEMCNEIFKECDLYNKKFRAIYKAKASAQTLQKVPIPTTTPSPVLPWPPGASDQELIHDTSNSKVMLILAVGAVVGFMIASIIWK